MHCTHALRICNFLLKICLFLLDTFLNYSYNEAENTKGEKDYARKRI